MNDTMEGIITCMTCMFAVALALGGPTRRQASQSEKTVPIGGIVTLWCPFVPDDTWQWVYWKKNDYTIYSLEVQSNTPWSNDTRYEGRNNATRLTIKDLKKTDGGIYLCKVASLATIDFIKEGGQVLLYVTDQEVGLSTTSPGVSFRTSTTIPPQPDEKKLIFLVLLLLIPIMVIFMTVCLVYQCWKRNKKLPAGSVIDFKILPRDGLKCQLCNNKFEENIPISCVHPKFCRRCLEQYGLHKHDLGHGVVCGRFSRISISRKQQWDTQQDVLNSMDCSAKCRRGLLKNCNKPAVKVLYQKLADALHVTGDNDPGPYVGSSLPPSQDFDQPTNGGGTKVSTGYNICTVETDVSMMSVTCM